MDNMLQGTALYPAISNFELMLDGKPLNNDIAKIEKDQSATFSLNMKLLGLDDILRDHHYANFASFINFCVYETNYSTGKGFRILDFFTSPLSMMTANSSFRDLKFDILTVNDNLKPMTGGWEGSAETPLFDFNQAFVSLRIFFSVEDMASLDDLDEYFYRFNNIVMDVKLPFKQVSSCQE